MKISTIIISLCFIATLCCNAQSDESNRLFAQGVELYEAGEYAEAIKVFERVDSIDTIELEENSCRQYYGKQWLASCWYHLNEITKAKEYDDASYHLPPIDRSLTVETDSITCEVIKAFESNDFITALSLIDEMNEKEEEIFGKDTYWSIGTWELYTYAYQGLEDYERAISYLTQYCELCKRWYCDDFDFSRLYLMMIDLNFKAGKFDEIEEWTNRAEEYIVRFHGLGSQQYDSLFVMRFRLYLTKKEWEKAESLINNQIKIVEQNFGKRSIEMFNMLNFVSNHYREAGRYKEAEHYMSKAIKHFDSKDDDEKYQRQLFAEITAASSLIFTGDFKKGEKKFNKIIKDTENKTDTLSRVAYWTALGSLGLMQSMNRKKMTKPITYEDYLQTKKEMSEISHLVGYFYILHSVFTDDFAANDTTLTTLREITAPYIESTSSDIFSSADGKNILAILYAFHQQASMCRTLSAQSTSDYKYIIDHPDATYTYDKIIKDLEQNSFIIKYFIDKEESRFIKSFDFLSHDSISYSLHKIRANLTECKLLLELKTDPDGSKICRDFSEYYVDMHLYCKDSLHYRSFMADYLKKIESKYGKNEDVYINLGYYYAKSFPKGSEEGKAFYEDLIETQRQNIMNSVWLTETLKDYYTFTDNKEALLEVEIEDLQYDYTDWYSKLKSKISLYMEAELLDKACEYIDEYFSMYPEINVDDGSYSDIGLYLLKNAPEKAYSYFDELLDKAEQNGNTSDILKIMTFLCAGDYYLHDDTSKELRQFARQQLAKRAVFVNDSSLLSHFMLYLVYSYGYSDKDEALSILSDLCTRDTENSLDKAEFLYTYARYHTYYTHRTGELERAVEYFESSDTLMRTAEYKTLLIHLFERLNPDYDAWKMMSVYDKIISVNPEIELCGSFFKKYGLDYYHYAQKVQHNRDYAEDVELEHLIKVLKKTGHIDQLKSKLVTSFGGQIHKIQTDLKRSYINWEDTADKASDLMSRVTDCAYLYADCDSLAILAYDASMLCKGMLLRAEGGLFSILEKSDNTSISEKFKSLQALNHELKKASSEGHDTEELQKKYVKARQDIINEANRLGSFTSNLECNSEHIARKLELNEAAVEFTSVTYDSTTTYYALCIKGGTSVPKVIELCTDYDLRAIKSPYTTDNIYYNVWLPIMHILGDVENLYFSPTGMLHQLAIEYVPMPDGVLISERMNIYRLSNTAELLNKKPAPEGQHNTRLYGGIIYEDKGEIILPTNYEKRSRFGIDYLPGTKEEIIDINDELCEKDYNVEMISGKDGTESSVKALSGTDTHILHLATHGFYLTNDEISNPTIANDPLLRSGLYMAGAASTVYGETSKPEEEDGILTAKDIADLDLSSTNLIVLSACQTALGDISGEGVFGLQRGFKKAGVGSILMSLWPVDDEATQILMTRFYHNLANNLSKNESLKEALKYLQTVDEGYFSDPEYWAAFILLDALD